MTTEAVPSVTPAPETIITPNEICMVLRFQTTVQSTEGGKRWTVSATTKRGLLTASAKTYSNAVALLAQDIVDQAAEAVNGHDASLHTLACIRCRSSFSSTKFTGPVVCDDCKD